MKKIIVFVSALMLFVSCDFPRDARSSFEQAKENGLKVGIAENPPFTKMENGKPSGTEVELIKDFAASEGLKVRFEKDSESDLIKKLEEFNLHMVVGGFEKKTQWKKKAATTITYDKEQHVFLIPKGENKLLQKLETYIIQNLKK